jgi:hypothetical protein
MHYCGNRRFVTRSDAAAGRVARVALPERRLRCPATRRFGLLTDLEHGAAQAQIGVLTAMRKHWFTALLPLVVLLATATVLGLKRTPQYTATATLSVGAVFVNSPVGIASAIQGTEALATVYSRVIDANEVVDGTARRLAERSLPNSGRVSATPLAETPIIRLTAVAASERQAVAVANAASAALADYVNREARSDDEATVLSRRYGRAALRYRRLRDESARLKRRYDESPTQENKRARDRAAAAAETALLERKGLLTSYESVVQGASSRPPLEVFATATAASSDRYRILQILLLTASVGGLLAGAALALLLELRATRPRYR